MPTRQPLARGVRRNPDKATVSTARVLVNAAALQDHLARSLALDLQPRRRLGPSIPSKRAACKQATVPVAAESEYRRVWICEACTFENEDTATSEDARCDACGALKTRRHHRPRLTLAQTLGLVQAPAPRLTRLDWEHCEQQALARGDAAQPCSICRESLGARPQVILSCTHMFHVACLDSFERFVRASQRVCPLCRKENYQKRATTQASGFHREQCARKIQAIVRGHMARKQQVARWHEFYRQGKGDPIRRRRFLANQVGKTADKVVAVLRKCDDSIDTLLAEFDATLSMSRRVFSGDNNSAVGSACDWASIRCKAIARADTECAICLTAFRADKQDAMLLSCSHVLHAHCLRGFEAFNIYDVLLCPLCRTRYQSRAWTQMDQTESGGESEGCCL